MLIKASLINEIISGRLSGDGNLTFANFVVDSREVKDNSFFIALPGERTDGHNFCQQAYNQGARGGLLREEKKIFPVEIIVDDTLKALIKLGKWVANSQPVHTIGVGGSVGKTSTKEMIKHILMSKYQVSATPASVNTEIGIPIYLLNEHLNPQVRVVEYGAQKIGDTDLLVDILKPNMLIITELGLSHMEYFKTLKKAREEEAELLVNSLNNDEWLVVNLDNNLIASLNKVSRHNVFTYGYSGYDFKICRIVSNLEGTRVIAQTPEGKIDFLMRHILGKQIAINSVGALAVGYLSGISIAEAAKTLENIKPVWGRMEKKFINGATFICDYYNSNPISLKAALKQFNSLKGKRKILVLGDMLELGTVALIEHQKISRLISKVAPDVLLTVGELSRNFHSVKITGKHFSTAKESGLWLKNNFQSDDLILVKGSRGIKMEDAIRVLSNEV